MINTMEEVTARYRPLLESGRINFRRNISFYIKEFDDDVLAKDTTEPEYEQFLADVWVGIVLTLMVLSCICCMCSCLLYHKFQQWKRSGEYFVVIDTFYIEKISFCYTKLVDEAAKVCLWTRLRFLANKTKVSWQKGQSFLETKVSYQTCFLILVDTVLPKSV